MTPDSFEKSSIPTMSFLIPPTALEYRTTRLKRLFTAWRNVLLPLNNLLEWQNSYDPLIIFASLSVLFLSIYLFNPPVLTLISCLMIFYVLVDLFGPKIFGIGDEFPEQRFINDQKFARLCERMACFEQVIEDYVQSIMKIRAEQPLMSITAGSTCLIFFAYCGQHFDNLILSYLFLLIACLLPGAIHRKIFRNFPQIILSFIRNRTKTH